MLIRVYFGAGSTVALQPVSDHPGAGLVVCPLVWQDPSRDGRAIDMLYRLAFERAQAALGPGRYQQLYARSPN